MRRLLAATVMAIPIAATACGGSAAPPTGQPAGVPTSAAQGSGGVRVALTVGSGPHAGTWDLTHTNPCRFNNPSDGAWALTATFPSAAGSDPSIVDMVLLEGESFIEPWFGSESIRAEDVTFSADDKGATATLTASGETSGGVPVQITVECDRVARY